MISRRIYPVELSEMLGVTYKKALKLLESEIESFIETQTTNGRKYRYTYLSLIEKSQIEQIENRISKHKTVKSRSVSGQPQSMAEAMKLHGYMN